MINIRPALPGDVPEILCLIRKLAEYEKLLSRVSAKEADMEAALFGSQPVAECLLAKSEGQIAGFALFYTTYSTFIGRPGFYLEDLFVRPAFRRQGIGRAFFVELARLAATRNYVRIEWAVLNWNEPAWKFYESLGARPQSEWTVMRLGDNALAELAMVNPI